MTFMVTFYMYEELCKASRLRSLKNKQKKKKTCWRIFFLHARSDCMSGLTSPLSRKSKNLHKVDKYTKQ